MLHVAVQGCLRGRNVAYGMTADTGGHIRYLLGLVEAFERDEGVSRVVIATRAFTGLGADYMQPREVLSPKTEIIRLATPEAGYLAKEDLWPEMPAFAAALVAWIQAQPRPPDLLHAHYADAGAVAAEVRARLGIPFLFTAHSLGRVKQRALAESAAGASASDPGLERRIASEEAAIAGAALVIASSRDEAELQYADYEACDPGRVRVLHPGADLAGFAAAVPSPAVDASIARFLNAPGKPVLLALARPVAKKNLAGLVRAFGESPELQEKANLVLIAGTRTDIDELEPEIASSLREILYLVDRYDLYGKVAYPKEHRPEDVPAIYAHARVRGGVFINPALNEPFGLTLLEAAAAGLPVVATDSGGPNDIIELCRNGELVNPHSPRAIADAALRILDDQALWRRYAEAGASAVRRFDWRAHAAGYGQLLRRLLAGSPARRPPADQLLVCDIDNTLIGCGDGVRSFTEWHRRQAGLTFGIATGRSFHSAIAVLEQEHAPLPEVMITSVGSEIHYRTPDGTAYVADRAWQAIAAAGWQRDAVLDALAGEGRIRLQALLEQRRFKVSYLTDGGADLAGRIEDRLAAAGLRCTVIHSHGRYLDVLPHGVSKGSAVEYVRRRLGLAKGQVFVAGDSGNDVEMLRLMPQAIIVGNFSDGLASLPVLAHGYVARGSYARGVIEGVDHFRRLRAAG